VLGITMRAILVAVADRPERHAAPETTLSLATRHGGEKAWIVPMSALLESLRPVLIMKTDMPIVPMHA
jgi:hypothetical protein